MRATHNTGHTLEVMVALGSCLGGEPPGRAWKNNKGPRRSRQSRHHTLDPRAGHLILVLGFRQRLHRPWFPRTKSRVRLQQTRLVCYFAMSVLNLVVHLPQGRSDVVRIAPTSWAATQAAIVAQCGARLPSKVLWHVQRLAMSHPTLKITRRTRFRSCTSTTTTIGSPSQGKASGCPMLRRKTTVDVQ